ncbi:type II toxin-antitoxin system VapC family toxin [Phaeospirillum tilakii]|uniref:Type II toxin-antitoxin system VapC family toxin n=1 Tax=Phaeospirillum tilakii TaxID=741673 RepID=A0ABW5CBM6_9PROT
MSGLVIDASIAVKWVVDEDGTQEALSVRKHALVAPDLLIPECANILWKKVRLGELTVDEAAFAARLLARADVDLAPMRSLMEEATRIAVSLDHPAYDCLYLALAESRGMPFATADERLLRKVRLDQTGRFSARVIGLAEAAALR